MAENISEITHLQREHFWKNVYFPFVLDWQILSAGFN